MDVRHVVGADLETQDVVSFTVAGGLLLLGGCAALRQSWLRKGGGHLSFRAGGWIGIATGIVGFCAAWGVEVGIAYALVTLSLFAYAVIASGLEIRLHKIAKVRELAPEPEERATNWARAAAKALLSIVLAGLAAIGIGVAFAVSMPLEVHDRLVVGGLLVPILWGAGMAWTLSDAKLVRATLFLLGISVVSYSIAFLPQVFAS